MSSDGKMVPLRVTARLAGAFAGEAPPLDSLLVDAAAHRMRHQGRLRPDDTPSRDAPAPDQWQVKLGIGHESLGGHRVCRCSSAILGGVVADEHEHFARRIDVANAGHLSPEARRIFTTTGSWTKSYRLPLRVRVVEWVAWFVYGDRGWVRDALRSVKYLGRKRSMGYGTIAKWEVDRWEEDWSWFAPSPAGPVLMRPLPVGSWLPAGIVGAKRSVGAVFAPYWHAERQIEVVTPC